MTEDKIAEDGKTELSLVHFTLTNPEWQPPTDAEDFVAALWTQARSCWAPQFSSLVASIFPGNTAAMAAGGLMDSSILMMPLFSAGAAQSNVGSGERAPGLGEPTVPAPTIHGGLSRAEGPIHSSERELLYSLQQGLPSSSLAASVFAPVPDMAPETDPLEFTAADMSLSTLYLHELHHRQVRRRGYQESGLNRSVWQRPHQDMPGIRELGDESGDMT